MNSGEQPEREVPAQAVRLLHDWLDAGPACLSFAQLPTPVQLAPWLSTKENEVWVKRDDASSALYGGGKVRKLEWLLANEPYAGHRPILTIGGHGSHHLLATALYLNRMDRRLHALVFQQPCTPHAERNLAALASLGTRFWTARTRPGLAHAMAAYYLWRRPPEMGTYMTPGASTPLGSFGCVEAGLELARQIESGEMPRPDRIYITGGTAGTSAGVAIGLALREVSTHLRIVSAVEPMGFNRWMYELKLRAIFRELRRYGLRGDAPSVSELLSRAGVTWQVSHSQIGGGYGSPTESGRAAVQLAADHGISLETTYTGKCLATLREDQRHEGIRAGGVTLFWNSHGANDLRPHIDEDWRSAVPPRFMAGIQRAALPAAVGSGAP